MRYNKENGIISLGIYELVATARRRISPLPPCDVDEPYGGFKGHQRGAPVEHRFSVGGHEYLLFGDVDFSDGRINIEGMVSSSVTHPKKEETEQIRGEGYISAYMVAKEKGLSSVEILFRYVSEKSGDYAEKTERLSLSRLEGFFNKCAEAIGIYAAPEIDRVTKRLPSLEKMKFPYQTPREAQREFISTAYKTLARGGRLYASAPTGTGKTVSALFPAMRALGTGRFDKVFYLTPKTTTAIAASECLELMASQGASVRAIILTAKDKCCRQGRVCKTSRKLCKNSTNNRIAEAALELYSLEKTVVDDKILLPVSEKYTVCPYELSLAYSELCDVVICDFNYLFDPFVYVKRYFEEGGRFAFLVDEAHNLPERVREAYSVEISEEDISELSDSEVLGEFSLTKKTAESTSKLFRSILFPLVKEEIRENHDGKKEGATHQKNLPDKLYKLFSDISECVENEIFQNFRANDEEKDERLSVLHTYYYKLEKFGRILSRFDDSYEAFIFYEQGRIRLKLFCLDTGAIISERLARGYSALLFSATLTPIEYYRSILGADRSDTSIEVASPFSPSQLSVNIMDKISTRFFEREDTLSAVVRVIAATVSSKRGNYMIFSPSFAYSEALAKRFAEKYPKIRVISQKRDMSRKEKEEFLASFSSEDKSYLVAFCVMGGIYSEGIDLAGDKLIGAVIVGIGLPGLSYEREAISAYYEERFEKGKQYAYIFPGMNRVFQAAGRVIRREDDKGVIVLIDDRFDDPLYKKSLPALWEGVKFLSDARELKEELDEFWKEEK